MGRGSRRGAGAGTPAAPPRSARPRSPRREEPHPADAGAAHEEHAEQDRRRTRARCRGPAAGRRGTSARPSAAPRRPDRRQAGRSVRDAPPGRLPARTIISTLLISLNWKSIPATVIDIWAPNRFLPISIVASAGPARRGRSAWRMSAASGSRRSRPRRTGSGRCPAQISVFTSGDIPAPPMSPRVAGRVAHHHAEPDEQEHVEEQLQVEGSPARGP